jgi:hypothetical protein
MGGARTARRGDTTVVTEIVAVVSVDLVADPATTRGLFEEQAPPTNESEPSTHAEEPSTDLSLSNSTPDDPAQTELETLRQQLSAALLREAGLREELEHRRDNAPTLRAQLPRSREQAAESLKRGPEPTREEARNAFVAALKRKS